MSVAFPKLSHTQVRIIFFGFALLYLFMIPFKPLPLDFLVKAVPALTLACWLFTEVKSWMGKALSAAMLLSAGGDVSLALVSKDNPDLFIVGLGFFLLAHIVFIIVFASDLKLKAKTAPALVLIPLFSGSMAFLLAPKLGEMSIPVYAYISVISVMGITAALNNRGHLVLLAGALLFVLSDSAIAVNKFLLDSPQPAAPYFIMVTYYIAQYMIAWAFVKTERVRTKSAT